MLILGPTKGGLNGELVFEAGHIYIEIFCSDCLRPKFVVLNRGMVLLLNGQH